VPKKMAATKNKIADESNGSRTGIGHRSCILGVIGGEKVIAHVPEA
jgi:hypothetical protein